MLQTKLASLLLTVVLLFIGCQPTGTVTNNAPTAATPEPETSDVGFSVKNMDLTADPRKDFARYAMGGWLDRTTIPDDKVQVAASSTLLDTLDKRLLAIAKDSAAATGDKKQGNVQIVGDFYTSAMDTKKLDELGIKPIEGLLAEADKAETPKQFGELAGKLAMSYGTSPLFNVSVSQDHKKAGTNAMNIDTGVADRGFGLNRNEFVSAESQKIRDNYVEYMAKLMQLAGDPADKAKERATKTLAFEKELAESTLTPVQMADPNATYNKLTKAELKALVPAVDFDAYFAGMGVPLPETVIVSDPGALKGMQKAISSRSVDDMRSFFRTSIVRQAAGFLGGELYNSALEYTRVKNGLPKMPPREKMTTDNMGFLMGHPFSRLYVEKYFNPEKRKAVVEMMDLIKAEFKKRIEANDWLSESTKATALQKLDKIQVLVGYPENESDWIDYSSVKIAPDDYFGNVARLREFNLRRNLSEEGKPVVIDQFTVPGRITPISMNAAIHQGFLVVYVTAAFMQPPYYVATNDAAANFGSLGAVVGHELTHAFDSKGRNYDVTGNLRDWWTPEDAANFKKRSEGLVKQYNAYEVAPGVKVNGELTLSENIADLGGLTLGFNALKTYMEKNGRLPDTDGLTPEQRFYIAWAQAWMAKTRPEILKVLVATDPHAPVEVRSFAPASNMNEFYEAFNIKEGDPMWRKPEDRVVIW